MVAGNAHVVQHFAVYISLVVTIFAISYHGLGSSVYAICHIVAAGLLNVHTIIVMTIQIGE